MAAGGEPQQYSLIAAVNGKTNRYVLTLDLEGVVFEKLDVRIDM